jgi:hypothetical protein
MDLIPAAMAAVAVFVMAVIEWRTGAAKLAHRAHRFASKLDLALPESLLPEVERRLAVRRRVRQIALGAALVVWWTLDGLTKPDLTGPSAGGTLVLVCAIVLLCVAVGELVIQVVDLRSRKPELPRASHLARPGVGDYVTPLELWAARGAAAVAVLVAVGLAVRSPGAAVIGLLGGVAGFWLLLEVFTRVIATSRPVAADVQSLAFDDAFRAESIRRAIGGSVVIPLVLAFAGWYLALPEWLAYGLLGLGVLAGAVLSWGEQSLRANRYFKQRLWEAPEPAAR